MHFYLQSRRREKERTRGRRERCVGGKRETAQRAGHIWWNHVGRTLCKNTLTLPKMLQIHPRQQDTHIHTRAHAVNLAILNETEVDPIVFPLHLTPAQTSQPITFPTLQACAVRTCEGQHNLTRRQDSARMFTRHTH